MEKKVYNISISEEEIDFLIDGLTLLVDDYQKKCDYTRLTGYDKDFHIYARLQMQAEQLQKRLTNE